MSENPFPPDLLTTRLVLRPPNKQDAEALYAAVSASFPALHRWLDWAKEPYTREVAETYCAAAQERFKARKEFPALILLKESGAIIGSVGLTLEDDAVPSFEIGYWLHTAHTGRGYVTEAVRAITTFAFDSLDAKRIQLQIDVLNAKSISVVERLGFKPEATLKSIARDNRGELMDYRIYAMFDRSELLASSADH